MKKATRLIIEEGNNIIFIKRTKKINGGIKTFYVLPGGMLDEGEDWEQAGIREAKEELNVDIKIDELLVEEYNQDLDKEERFYFATVLKGKVQAGKGEEFQNIRHLVRHLEEGKSFQVPRNLRSESVQGFS